LHYFPQRLLELVGRRLTTFGIQLGQFSGQGAGGREQEVSRTASRVDNPQIKESVSGLFRIGGQTLTDYRLEGGIDQGLHQDVRGVVRTSQLAQVAGGGAVLVQADKAVLPWHGGYR